MRSCHLMPLSSKRRKGILSKRFDVSSALLSPRSSLEMACRNLPRDTASEAAAEKLLGLAMQAVLPQRL